MAATELVAERPFGGLFARTDVVFYVIMLAGSRRGVSALGEISPLGAQTGSRLADKPDEGAAVSPEAGQGRLFFSNERLLHVVSSESVGEEASLPRGGAAILRS